MRLCIGGRLTLVPGSSKLGGGVSSINEFDLFSVEHWRSRRKSSSLRDILAETIGVFSGANLFVVFKDREDSWFHCSPLRGLVVKRAEENNCCSGGWFSMIPALCRL